MFVALIWLGQLLTRTGQSSACLFPSGESVLVCSSGRINVVSDCPELSLSLSIGAHPLPFIRQGREQCTQHTHSPHGTFSVVLVIVGPLDPVVAALRLAAGSI